MRTITIYNVKALENLNKISSREDVKIIITSAIQSVEAVDLTDFKGNIYVSFENPSSFIQCFTKGCRETKRVLFFENVNDQTRILYPNDVTIKYTFCDGPFIHYLKNNITFQIFQNYVDRHESNQVVLASDLLLSDIPSLDLSYFKGCIEIFGHFHTVYYINSENPQLLGINAPKADIKEKNIEYQKVDQIIKIYCIKDFDKLREITSGNIVVQIQNDIKNNAMKSVDLSNFVGTMKILGNGCVLENIAISSSNEGLGLISKIHPYANLYIENLELKHINVIATTRKIIGMVGFRKIFENHSFASPNGIICFKNCQANFDLFPNKITAEDFLIGIMDSGVKFLDKENNLTSFSDVFYEERNQMIREKVLPKK